MGATFEKGGGREEMCRCAKMHLVPLQMIVADCKVLSGLFFLTILTLV